MKGKALATLISESKQINASYIFNDHLEGLSYFAQSYTRDNSIYVTSFDSTISLYDINATKSVSLLLGHTKGVWTCTTNPNSTLLISGGNDNNIIIWDSSSNAAIKTLQNHFEVIYDVQFSSNGKFFAACSKGLITIWDVANLKSPIETIKEFDIQGDAKNEFIYCINFLDEDKKIITGFIDGTILIHDINSKNTKKITLPNFKGKLVEEEPLSDYANAVYSLSKFNKSDKILLSHSDGSVRIYDTSKDKFQMLDSFSYFCGAVTSANTSLDDTMIVACAKDRYGQVWKTNSHTVIDYTLIGHKNIVSYSNFITNDLVATCSYDNTFRLWKI